MSDLADNLGGEYPSDWQPFYIWNSPFPTVVCGHSLRYKTEWYTSFCGLCFLKNGYRDELPGRIHVGKQLADNGNPQQTGSFQGHVHVVEGIQTPQDDETMTHFRGRIGQPHRSKEQPGHFPFADSLWYISSRQPPLAKPLILSVVQGHTDHRVAELMGVSLLNVVGRMEKAVNMATNYIKQFHG